MSMNKYMHPRNIYRHPPNFKDLAIQYPEFRQFVTQDITGKVTLDFKDVNALRALSRVLLLKDFDLNVDIPLTKLVPTIPLRLNYLLWIDDLLSTHKLNLDEVCGIDIGTGASCVYPLMAASKFKWKMIGTEIDKESIVFAKRNVSQNFLNDKIQIFEATGNTLLSEVVVEENQSFHFCMCNPPFFTSTQELHPFFKSRKSSRPHPKNAFCASVGEVVVKGGEVEFITKLIRESVVLKNKILIYTSMVGHKSNLVPLKVLLKEVGINSFKETEFCQGNTTRWGLAWTFCDFDLRAVPSFLKSSKFKNKPPLTYVVPKLENNVCSVESVDSIILRIFGELMFEVAEFKRAKKLIVYDVKARTNTWSNQRRRRREKLKKSIIESDIPERTVETETENGIDSSFNSNSCSTTVDLSLINPKSENISVHDKEILDLQDASIRLAEMDIASTTPKREHEEDDQCYYNKKLKENLNDNKNWLVNFFISIRRDESSIILELFSLDNNTNRELIHQILQYIKNNWNK